MYRHLSEPAPRCDTRAAHSLFHTEIPFSFNVAHTEGMYRKHHPIASRAGCQLKGTERNLRRSQPPPSYGHASASSRPSMSPTPPCKRLNQMLKEKKSRLCTLLPTIVARRSPSGPELSQNVGAASADGFLGTDGGQSPRPRDGTDGRSEVGGMTPRSIANKSQAVGGGVGGAGDAPKSSVGGGGGGGMGSSSDGVHPRGVQLTAVTFAANAPVLAVGEKIALVSV